MSGKEVATRTLAGTDFFIYQLLLWTEGLLGLL